jgi:hypothetical protein
VQRLVCFVTVALAGILLARASDLTRKELRAAQDLNELKCAKCHKLYNPADYSQEEWDVWMKKMARKSKLKKAQEELLTRYLQTLRDKPAAASPSR